MSLMGILTMVPFVRNFPGSTGDRTMLRRLSVVDTNFSQSMAAMLSVAVLKAINPNVASFRMSHLVSHSHFLQSIYVMWSLITNSTAQWRAHRENQDWSGPEKRAWRSTRAQYSTTFLEVICLSLEKIPPAWKEKRSPSSPPPQSLPLEPWLL